MLKKKALKFSRLKKKSRIRETTNLSTNADSSTNIFVFAGVKKGADSFFLTNKKTSCPIWNTSPFLGLHARGRDAMHQSTDKGRSAPVHAKKTCMGRGHIQTYIYTNIHGLSDNSTVSAQWADWVKNPRIM